MNCPDCKGKTRVIDSSFNYVNNERYRKRLCTKCGKKFYTIEKEIDYNKIKYNYYKFHRHSTYLKNKKSILKKDDNKFDEACKEHCNARDCLCNYLGYCASSSDTCDSKLGRECPDYVYDEFERR